MGSSVAVKKQKIVKYLMIVTVHAPRVTVHEPYKKSHGKPIKGASNCIVSFVFYNRILLP